MSAVLTAAILSITACTQLKTPEPEAYFSKTEPPAKQELRWTNGKLPKTFDPALAAAAPEIDVARAIFDGLTDLDPETLEAVPALAEKWTSDKENKEWTFYLREDAKWSNGEKITAEDFVRSWKRLGQMGEKVPHRDLLLNIVGLAKATKKRPGVPGGEPEVLSGTPEGRLVPAARETATPERPHEPATPVPAGAGPPSKLNDAEPTSPFGIVAVNSREIKISLIHPDKDLPKLVAHPVFRPVQNDIPDKVPENPVTQIVTSGAFRISSLGAEELLLDRFESYWDMESVKLERVRFVPSQTAEKALEAYRNGTVDVVSNSEFSPAALKLLEPYEDFRRTTYAALNFYELNIAKAPYSDRRVREALAIAIERESLTEGELGGSTRPAFSFTPFSKTPGSKFSQDKERAAQLLEDAGFPDGKGFPVIRLLINRNDTQQRIARSVARMWKQNLNIDTEIVVKEPAEIAAARASGDWDAIRRGAVIATPDETANLLSMFFSDAADPVELSAIDPSRRSDFKSPSERQTPSTTEVSAAVDVMSREPGAGTVILTEDQAIFGVQGIPLYFPTSYSLVKPYVKGFDANSLDAPMLKRVEIDNKWRPK